MICPEKILAEAWFRTFHSPVRCQQRRWPERVLRGLEDLRYDTLWVTEQIK
jgi:hypothetical protein